MDNEILIWLYDIKSAIEEIESFFNEGEKKFELFIEDIKTKRAVERNIEIIGEAVNRILKKNKNFDITNARKIVDSRNRISHGYDKISDEVIWGIVIKYLPLLKKEIETLMKGFQ